MIDIAATAMFATPVCLAAVGESVNQRAGQINIGLEGAMLSASFASVAVVSRTGSLWLGLLAGVLAALAVTLIQNLFTINFGQDQVIVGTAVNLGTMGLTATLFRAEHGQSGKLLSVPTLPAVQGLNMLALVALVSALVAWWALKRTNWGLAVSACGERPEAVEAAGYSVYGIRWSAALIGGMMAGLAGTQLSLGIAGSFGENMVAGRGFVALALVTFGRWNPLGTFMASMLVGLAESLQFWFQAKKTDLPHQLFVAMPYLVSLLVLLAFAGRSRAPSALAEPYHKG